MATLGSLHLDLMPLPLPVGPRMLCMGVLRMSGILLKAPFCFLFILAIFFGFVIVCKTRGQEGKGQQAFTHQRRQQSTELRTLSKVCECLRRERQEVETIFVCGERHDNSS